MKCKPRGSVARRVASSTLAYPGNSFKYSPQCPPDKPQEKLPTLDVTTSITLQCGAAKAASSAVSDRRTSDADVPSSAAAPHSERPSVVLTEAGPLQKRSRVAALPKCDKPCLPSEEGAPLPGGLNQEQLQLKKVIVEVLHKVEKDVQEMEGFSKNRGKEVKNGPKKCKNSSVLTNERC